MKYPFRDYETEASKEYKKFIGHLEEEVRLERQAALAALLESEDRITPPKRGPMGTGMLDYHGQFSRGNGTRWIRPKKSH